MLKRLQPHAIMTIEAGLLGLFFVQSLRFLIAIVYSQVAGASVVSVLSATGALLPDPLPVDPAIVNADMATLGILVALPIIATFFMPLTILPLIAAIGIVTGRLFMAGDGLATPTVAAALATCAGLVYILALARHRLRVLPYFFMIGFTADMVIRSFGNTVDLSLRPAFGSALFGLGVAALLLAVASAVLARARGTEAADRGLMPLHGAIGLAGLLFLWLALFGLPNAVTARAGVDYAQFTPALVAAALLPIIPTVRGMARNFIASFDAGTRGWLWFLLLALLLIVGTRLSGLGAAIAMVAATFGASLSWWWVARPKGEKERSLGGVWMLVAIGLFAVLLLADNFTYEYAFVRDFTGDLAFLNPFVPPLLRGFRGFGLGLLLLASFLAILPMIQTRQRIPWVAGASRLASLVLLMAGAGVVALTVVAVTPPVIVGVSSDSIRVATYNIHGGYDEFFVEQREALARTIAQTGADVVLLQEVEAGRLASSGVDQSLWLARRLGMDRRYYGTNEALHGLAVLSRVPIAFDDGLSLASTGAQTGVQRVQITPREGVIVTIFNLWLSPLYGIGDGAIAQEEQDQQRQLSTVFTDMVGQACSLELGRAVLGGTLHNVPDSPLMSSLTAAGFNDPFAGQLLEVSATFDRIGQPRARFDYLWLCNLPSEGTGVERTAAASDHRIAYTAVSLR